jgi:tripartite-type tricarboxylate transporter receptor subunit TctC
MNHPLASAIALAIALGLACAAAAQPYPTKPIHLIVPASPGTGLDYLGRNVALALSEIYKQQVICDNRAGAGSLIGSGLIVSAVPDGYTIGVISTSTIVAPLLQAKQPYRPIEDFAPIALLASITSVLAVAPGIPAKNAQEFVALARSKPGQFNFASIGAGSASHLSVEIFNRAAGIDAVHVPFKTIADSYTEMLSGRVHYFVYVAPAAVPLTRDGKLRALAVTSAKRSASMPNVPTVVEVGLPGAVVDTMIGVVGPAAMSKPVVSKLSADIVSVLRRPETKESFERQGAEPTVDTTPESYAVRLKAEYERYRTLIREIGLKPQN